MVVPREICNAAANAERDRVLAWLDAGGSINDVDESGYTLVHCCVYGVCVHEQDRSINDQHVALARHLIALGADVNIATHTCGPHYGEDGTAEDILERRESLESSVGLAGNEHWMEIKALVHGVRKYGTYKRYARSFHRDVLTVRGLAQRGKLSTSDPVLNFLARLGDNGVVWHVLEYWRATN